MIDEMPELSSLISEESVNAQIFSSSRGMPNVEIQGKRYAERMELSFWIDNKDEYEALLKVFLNNEYGWSIKSEPNTRKLMILAGLRKPEDFEANKK